jgi:predicted NBD/HSP70 family sugar kinase
LKGSQHAAVDASRMRLSNLSLVLTALIRESPTSQAALARLTGLNKATVSSIVEELIEGGWVRAEGRYQGDTGRPRQLLVPNADRGYLIGAEINVDYLAALVTDFSGRERTLLRETVDVRNLAVADAVGGLKRLVLQAVEKAGAAREQVLGIALGVPGVISDNGTLLVAPKIDWHETEIGALLQEDLGDMFPRAMPPVVENEANLGAFAERGFGRCVDVPNFVHLSGEIGVGAGVFINGELFRGTHGAGGEVGHVTIDPNGPKCECGKVGCWTKYVSRRALNRYVRERKAAGRRSSLWEGDGARLDHEYEPALVAEAAREGDAVAKEAVDEIERYLAIGIGNLVSTYDPQVVALGGFFTSLFAETIDQLKGQVDGWVMGEFGKQLRVELSSKGQDSCLWGGIAFVLRQLVVNPRLLPAPARTEERSA